MTSVAVAEAIGRVVADRGTALLALFEDQWFDRKSGRISSRDLANSLIGFANADGGTLVVGLHGGLVEGIDRQGTGRRNELQQAPLDLCVPPLRVRSKLLRCARPDGPEDHLLVFDVEPTGLVHANTRDDVYLRVGDENRRLNYRQRHELEYDKGQAWYEASPIVDADWSEIDDAVLDSYATAVQARDPRRLLQARGLVTPRGVLTVGAILLFGREPQARFPQALVRVVRYRGAERGTGSRQELLADVRCDGPIPEQLNIAQQVVFEHIPARQALGGDGRFGPVGLVPRDAWLEGLVNAVVHRSYSLAGDHIRIEIFDDRVEIESPGRFPGLVDLTDPARVTRFARNPRIARVCADLRFGVERGEGVRRIYEEMRLAGLADPEYFQTSGSVRLTLTTTPVDRELEARLPPAARDLVRAIRDIDRPSTGDLVDASGVSRPVVLRRLRELVDLGLIEWIGTSKRDPRAYWRIAQARL